MIANTGTARSLEVCPPLRHDATPNSGNLKHHMSRRNQDSAALTESLNVRRNNDSRS